MKHDLTIQPPLPVKKTTHQPHMPLQILVIINLFAGEINIFQQCNQM